ncbi:MAG: ParB family transcriptional regulator, chromosome partitioning protein [Candidatus Parcubacteria bacterium]|jgi:ParB family chromosome partitioning protein|nr:ParB family transcriptional regulator, chromosome partitioning protein [Candidatus Parcubacteria bacterium]
MGGDPDLSAGRTLEAFGFVRADNTKEQSVFPYEPRPERKGHYELHLTSDLGHDTACLMLFEGIREIRFDQGRVVGLNKPSPKSQRITVIMEGSHLVEWHLDCRLKPDPTAPPAPTVLSKVSDPLLYENVGAMKPESKPASPTLVPKAPPVPEKSLPVPQTKPVAAKSGDRVIPIAPLVAKGPPSPEPGNELPNSASAIIPEMIIQEILASRIRRNEKQPRKHFAKGKLKKLGNSMLKKTQRQLIEVVRVYGDPNADFELITGERRWRAAGLVGMKKLKAIVHPDGSVPDKKTQHRMCFIADCHREDYSKLEYALGLLEEKENGASVEELCEITGKSNAWVYQLLRINNLVPELKKLLDPELPRSHRLSLSLAYPIATVAPEKQMGIYHQVSKIAGARLQLIEVKRLVREANPDKAPGRVRGPNDYVRNLGWIAPRIAADAITASGFSDKVFDSLVTNTHPDKVKTMTEQIVTAREHLRLLDQMIKDAQKRAKAKKA